MALHWWCKLHWLNVESCVCNIWWVCCLFSRTSSVNKTIAQSTRGVMRSSIEIEAWIKAVLVSYNSKMCKKHFFCSAWNFFSCCLSFYVWIKKLKKNGEKKTKDWDRFLCGFVACTDFLWIVLLITYVFSNWYIVTCFFPVFSVYTVFC